MAGKGGFSRSRRSSLDLNDENALEDEEEGSGETTPGCEEDGTGGFSDEEEGDRGGRRSEDGRRSRSRSRSVSMERGK